jgi:hypothetical protein
MFARTRIPIVLVIILALVSFFGLTGLASAHGQTTVGDYTLEIGFHVEPPYLGQPNGLDLFVTNTKTGEKVNGLESTLKAEIIHGSSRRTLNVTAQDEVDGAYTADIVPTATGDYTWRIFGQILDTPVDVSMTSSPTTFSSVDTMAAAEFPVVYPSASELQTQAASIAQMAQVALTVGIAGVVLGAAGLIVALTRRRPAAAAADQTGSKA